MRKAIAVDFDGCLCTSEYPAIGKPNKAVIERAKREQEQGAGIILWSCREGQLLRDAVNACREWGLIFDAVNESLPDWIEAFGTNPRKVGASEYWDDKAVQMPEVQMPNDPLTLEELQKMDGETVWVDSFVKGIPSFYAVIHGKMLTGFVAGSDEKINLLTNRAKAYGLTWLAYRRKPEEVQE